MLRVAVVVLSAALIPSLASAETPRQLTGAEIGRVTGKSLGALRRCYVEHTAAAKKATGRVEIDLIVHRDGSPFRVEVGTPGVKSAKLTACLTAVARRWRFPRRRGFTRTVVPFLFLRTRVAGAGPAYSCWNAGGCETPKRDSAHNHEGPRLSKRAD